MNELRKIAVSTGLFPRDDVAGEQMLALQYEHLKHHIPLLYLTIGFYFTMAVIFIISQIPISSWGSLIATYFLPSVIIPFSLIRAFIWYRRRNDEFEYDEAIKTVKSVTAISAFIALMCGYWSVLAWYTEGTEHRSYLALIMAMGGFSAAYCLSIIPFSAIFNLVAVLLPLNIVMIISGETFLIAVATTVITAMVYFAGLLGRHYRQMVHMIELQVQMHGLANTDILTGLLNRRALIEEYGAIVHGENNSLVSFVEQDETDDTAIDQEGLHKDSETKITNVTMVMLDLDGFKPINDEYGHATGDKMLKIVADRMSLHIAEYGTTARIGGDEFAIMFVNKPLKFCQQMIESLSYILSSPYIIDGTEKHIGISYGIAHRDSDIGSIEKLLSRADADLYDMKALKNATHHRHSESVSYLNISP